MTPNRTLRGEVLGIALAIAAGVAGSATPYVHRAAPAVQLAQEVYGSPIGEYDRQIGGPMAYGEPVGNGPIGGPAMYGEAVGNGPIGGPSMYGEAVGNGPIGGPAMYGAPVGSGGDDAPIGGDTLY